MPIASPPPLCRHRARDLAYVRIHGRQRYLGRWDSPEAVAEYDRICRDWRAAQEPQKYALTVADVTVHYLDYALGYYQKSDRATSEVQALRDALRPLNDMFMALRAADLRPRHVKEYQNELVRRGLARTTINASVGRVRRMLKWAISEELLPADVLTAIQTVAPLKKGRSKARETKPVKAVPDALIDVVLPHVPAAVRGLIQFQRLTGARPSEARLLRMCDVNTSAPVWEYEPVGHKCEHHDKTRLVMVGTRAQTVLREFITPDLKAYVFCPEGSAGARPYERTAYRNAIVRGCEVAYGMPQDLRSFGKALKNVSKEDRPAARIRLRRQAREWRRQHCWSPNALRHSFGTAARRALGIEAARTALGHSTLTASQIYCERNMEAAREVAVAIG